MKIVVSRPASVYDDQRDIEIADPAILKSLHGLVYDQDVCSNFFSADPLALVSISGGAIALSFDEQHQRLRVISEYWAPRTLNDAEIAALTQETQGQWSDGLGAACFDDWSAASQLRLDLSPEGAADDMRVEQVEDGRLVPRFAHLARAVWKGHLEVVREAVAEKAELNARYEGFTALHLAIRKNSVPAALLLVDGGADVNLAAAVGGTTPLMACAGMHSEDDSLTVAQALLAHGASSQAKDASNRTALALAKKAKKTRLAALLEAQQPGNRGGA